MLSNNPNTYTASTTDRIAELTEQDQERHSTAARERVHEVADPGSGGFFTLLETVQHGSYARQRKRKMYAACNTRIGRRILCVPYSVAKPPHLEIVFKVCAGYAGYGGFTVVTLTVVRVQLTYDQHC